MHEITYFLTQHGTFVLFAVVLAEQLGLPVPAIPFLIAAGAFIGTGQLTLESAVGAAIIAALLGDQFWFELGRRRGRQVLNWLCRISFEPTACVRRTEEFFARHGARSLIVAKFVPGLSTIAPPLAGVVGLRLPQYLLYNSVGTILWVGSGIGLGYAFSDQLEQMISVAEHLGSGLALITVGGVVGYAIYKMLHRYRVERLVPRLTAQQLAKKVATEESPLIIDLRPLEARQEVPGIPGSVALSFDELIAGHRELPRNRDVVLYCDCPKDAASVQAAWRLRKHGLARVWPLAGGIEAWHAAAREAGTAGDVSEHQPVPA